MSSHAVAIVSMFRIGFPNPCERSTCSKAVRRRKTFDTRGLEEIQTRGRSYFLYCQCLLGLTRPHCDGSLCVVDYKHVKRQQGILEVIVKGTLIMVSSLSAY